jgi:hypothetical protein
MARTKKQIEQSLSSDMEAINPSLDTLKGPVPDIFIRPQASQLRAMEVLIDDLNKRYSLDYIRTRNTKALELYGANHGLRKSPGRPARGHVYFFTFSRLEAGARIYIPAGTVVSTSDTSISYRTTKEAIVIGESIDSYYNATKRRYEIRVPVESLGTSDVFDIPPGRIRQIQSSITGINGVDNREYISGSQEAEDNETFGRNIRAKFNGTAQGSGDGLRQIVQNFDSTRIYDVHLVFSTDYNLFRRRTRRAAWDVYLIGEDSQIITESFVGNGSRTQFQLTNLPVLSVSSVLVNNVSVPYSLVKDTTDQTQTSARANDLVMLSSAPLEDIAVDITYNYDKLITDTAAYIAELQHDLYDADILVRKAIPVSIMVTVSIQVLSTFDKAQAVSDTLSAIQAYGDLTTFVSLLSPDELRTRIEQEVSGISFVRVLEFSRIDYGTAPVQPIEFLANEYPVISTENITIVTRS